MTCIAVPLLVNRPFMMLGILPPCPAVAISYAEPRPLAGVIK